MSTLSSPYDAHVTTSGHPILDGGLCVADFITWWRATAAAPGQQLREKVSA